MLVRRHHRRRQITVSLICIAVIGYFATHATQGRHGHGSRQKLIERAELLGAEIDRLVVVRGRLVNDVALLNLESPDRDLVEEIAADLFGVLRPGDRAVRGALPR
jgi:cell division protein FtsB